MAALQAWIQRAADETGRLDVMINNAGFGDFGTSFLGGDPDIWKGMLDVNVLALAAGSQAACESEALLINDGARSNEANSPDRCDDTDLDDCVRESIDNLS